MHSDDKKIRFLRKVSKRAQPQNTEMKRIGSNTPLFLGANGEQEDVASLLGGTVAVTESTASIDSNSEEISDAIESGKSKDTLRAAVHMDAMAFGMGCCCLQITFQAKDVDESRFIFDQLNVMAPMYVLFVDVTRRVAYVGFLLYLNFPVFFLMLFVI